MQTSFDVNDIYSIEVRFKCPFCQQEVHSGYVPLHGADAAAKDNSESYVCEDYDAICDTCDE